MKSMHEFFTGNDNGLLTMFIDCMAVPSCWMFTYVDVGQNIKLNFVIFYVYYFYVIFVILGLGHLFPFF